MKRYLIIKTSEGDSSKFSYGVMASSKKHAFQQIRELATHSINYSYTLEGQISNALADYEIQQLPFTIPDWVNKL